MRLLLKNVFSLGLVQGINLIIPLLITPFLIKIVGVSSFGIIATAQAVVVFFTLFTDFGFNITAVRSLAQAQGDKNNIEGIVSGVLLLKIILLAASFFVFLGLILLVPQFREHFQLYLLSFFIVIGQALLPIWFYQGTEKLSKTVIPVIVLKLLTVAALFYFIRREADAYLVNFIFGVGNIFTGIILILLIRRSYRVEFKSLNRQVLKNEFRGSFAIFVGNIAIAIYSNSSLLILSFFLNPYALGIYSIVDKIVQLIRALLSLIHQATYPRLCNIVKNAEHALFSFIRKVYGVLWFAILCFSVFVLMRPDIIVSFFIKDPDSQLIATKILSYFSFLLFVNSLNMPFYQTLLAYNKDWLTVKILLVACIISITLNLTLVPIFRIEGTVIVHYIVEMTVAILMITSFFKLKRLHEKRNIS